MQIIKRYEDRLAWWVSEPDDGQVDAINKGIRRTSGEVVAYINSDDYYLPGAFEAAISELERMERRWVAGPTVIVLEREDGPPRDAGVLQPKEPSSAEHIPRGRHWWVLKPWQIYQPGAFWRRSLFDEFGLFREDMHFAFDAEFELRCALAGAPPSILRGPVIAAQAYHAEQKSSDPRRWRPELRRFTELHRASLTPAERRWLRWLRPPLVLWQGLRDYLIHPLLRAGGRLLDHLPQRIRPRVRHRDRRPHLADRPGVK